MSILVLQSSRWGRESWVQCFILSSWCLVIVVWLFLAMPRVCLQFVILVFPDHTHLLFFSIKWRPLLKHFNSYAPAKLNLKLPFASVACIYSLALLNNVSIETVSVDPDCFYEEHFILGARWVSNSLADNNAVDLSLYFHKTLWSATVAVNALSESRVIT